MIFLAAQEARERLEQRIKSNPEGKFCPWTLRTCNLANGRDPLELKGRCNAAVMCLEMQFILENSPSL